MHYMHLMYAPIRYHPGNPPLLLSPYHSYSFPPSTLFSLVLHMNTWPLTSQQGIHNPAVVLQNKSAHQFTTQWIFFNLRPSIHPLTPSPHIWPGTSFCFIFSISTFLSFPSPKAILKIDSRKERGREGDMELYLFYLITENMIDPRNQQKSMEKCEREMEDRKSVV